jgi:hypothetical protein
MLWHDTSVRRPNILVRVPVSAYIYFLLTKAVFSQIPNQTVRWHVSFLIICFKSYSCCTGKARNARDSDTAVVFTSFVSFVYRHSDINRPRSNVVVEQACQTRWCLWAVVSQEILHWAAQFAKYRERNCWVYDGCAWEERGSRVVSPSTRAEVSFMVVWAKWWEERSTVGTGICQILVCRRVRNPLLLVAF